ncbi:MAG: hypothetical protein M1829_003780 [Trizodia sp. TS-e1964]|nr:MAG: hypothetical protein M1829_003780 [Trizodia sp. TS-e1964]
MKFLALSALAASALASMDAGMQPSRKSTAEFGIIIIETNEGGGCITKEPNQPSMNVGMTHMVTVGGSAGLVYTPETISAAVGDVVVFTFMASNHTVTQSSFGAPCVKMEGGVDSGFMPNPNSTLSPAPWMKFQVVDTKPVWFYCRQKSHCGKGMVFSINPTADKSQSQFKAVAMQQNGTASAATAVAATSMASSKATSGASMDFTSTSTFYLSTTTTVRASSAVVAASSSSVSLVSPMATGVVAGAGSPGTGGQCSCSCLCGIAAFPIAAGIGGYGGYGGKLILKVP